MNYARFTNPDVVLSNMVEIYFVDDPEDGFRKVKETLQRMGVQRRGYKDEQGNFIEDKILIQSCHILHKRGKYYICHFKELFALDGKPADFTEEDEARRNLIVKYLVEWNLIQPENDEYKNPMGHPKMLKVIKYSEVNDWVMESKYTVGNSREYMERT